MSRSARSPAQTERSLSAARARASSKRKSSHAFGDEQRRLRGAAQGVGRRFVNEQPIVHLPRGRARRGGDGSLRADQAIGRRPHEGQGEGVALLRHDLARAGMAIGELDEAEFGRAKIIRSSARRSRLTAAAVATAQASIARSACHMASRACRTGRENPSRVGQAAADPASVNEPLELPIPAGH